MITDEISTDEFGNVWRWVYLDDGSHRAVFVRSPRRAPFPPTPPNPDPDPPPDR